MKNTFNKKEVVKEMKGIECTEGFPSLPYVIKVTNTSKEEKKCFLFEVSDEYFDGKNKNDNSLKIEMEDGYSSYEDLKKEFLINPCKIGEMHILSSTLYQPFKPIKFLTHKNNGSGSYHTVFPRLDPMQNQSGVCVLRVSFILNGSTQMSFSVAPETSVYFSLYPKSQVNISNILDTEKELKINYNRPIISIIDRWFSKSSNTVIKNNIKQPSKLNRVWLKIKSKFTR